MSPRRIYRIDDVCLSTGLSRSSVYKQVRIGAFPKGIKITDRATGWPEDEVRKINEARISGFSAPELHNLVKELEAARGAWP